MSDLTILQDWVKIFERKNSTGNMYKISNNSPGMCPGAALPKDDRNMSPSTDLKQKVPERVLLDGQTFCDAFPYHVVFDKNMVIKHCGTQLQAMCPRINDDGAKITDFMILRHPVITLGVDTIRQFIYNIFMAEIIRETMDTRYQDKPPMLIRGKGN